LIASFNQKSKKKSDNKKKTQKREKTVIHYKKGQEKIKTSNSQFIYS